MSFTLRGTAQADELLANPLPGIANLLAQPRPCTPKRVYGEVSRHHLVGTPRFNWTAARAATGHAGPTPPPEQQRKRSPL
jgi:hypothetical protein